MHLVRQLGSLLVFGALALSSARADDPALRAAAALYDGLITDKLANGLRYVLKPIPGAPVVTTMMAYKVGSSDEELTATGLSHYLEHLMFKGTEKRMPGDIDRMTQRSGGRNNAYTNEDFTNYHFQFAADQWQTALEIEADRMRNLRIDERHEFEQEKGAVIAELDRNEDQPYDLEVKTILPMLFGKGEPYGHPVIGEKAHVRTATVEVIKGHYDRWYYPNNAVLVVCGGFDPDKAQARIRELFGPIPAQPLPDRKLARLAPRRTVERAEIASKFEVPRMLMGFNGVRMSDADNATLNVIQSILAGGRTARLYKKLVEEEAVASDVGTGNNSGRYPGWFSIQVELLTGQSRDKAEALVVAELKRLALEPVPADELKRVQRGLVAGTIFSREGVHELADSIAHAVMQSDLEELKTELPKIMAVTPTAIQIAAKKYLDPNRRVVVWSVPKVTAGGSSGARLPAARSADRPPSTGGSFDIEATQRVVLPNGLTVLLLENHRMPIVAADVHVRGTRTHEPAEKAGVASLLGTMLDEGTRRRSGPQIAAAIEDVGGVLDLHSAGGSVRVLAPDRTLGLDLLFNCLSQPSFPADALERHRAMALSSIDDSKRRANVRARRQFLGILYGPDHPLGRPTIGLRPVVEKLTRGDLQAYHAALFVPNNTIVAVVGDFKSDEVIAEISRLSADWKPRDVPPVNLPAPKKPDALIEEIISVPQANQLNVYLGHPGIRRADPNFYKLLVMDNVLGTGSGFTDRLSANLRDRQGLAYNVSASISADASEEPGAFTCYIGTFPDKLAAVKKAILMELDRFRGSEPATNDEVEDAKKYLLGSLPFHFATSASVAEEVLRIERFGLGFDYRTRYRQAVASVTPADVLAVARQYLDPAHLVIVAAGPVRADGQPLPEEK